MAGSFLFDPNRCTGCHACRLACTIENELAPAVSWRRIETLNPRRIPSEPVYHLSLACHHCEQPACLPACPTRAITRDAATSLVALDADRCIGCRYCAWACPFEAPVFDAGSGIMTKCTGCPDRVAGGGKPACATQCPTGALDWDEIPPAFRVQETADFPATDLEPAIRIRALRPGARVPELTTPPPASVFVPEARRDPAVSVRSEWPLAAFTLAFATLVGLMTAAAAWQITIEPLRYLGIALGAAFLSTRHLGRPWAAPRALLGIGTSWLSREVALFGLFVVTAAAWLLLGPEWRALGWAAAVLGFFGLHAADRVYAATRFPSARVLHSSGVLWTGALVAAVAAMSWAPAVLLGLGKLVLYLHRKRFRRPLASVARIGLGMAAPVALVVVDPIGLFGVTLVTLLAGEAVDRIEFFAEWQAPAPQSPGVETPPAPAERL